MENSFESKSIENKLSRYSKILERAVEENLFQKNKIYYEGMFYNFNSNKENLISIYPSLSKDLMYQFVILFKDGFDKLESSLENNPFYFRDEFSFFHYDFNLNKSLDYAKREKEVRDLNPTKKEIENDIKASA